MARGRAAAPNPESSSTSEDEEKIDKSTKAIIRDHIKSVTQDISTPEEPKAGHNLVKMAKHIIEKTNERFTYISCEDRAKYLHEIANGKARSGKTEEIKGEKKEETPRHVAGLRPTMTNTQTIGATCDYCHKANHTTEQCLVQ